ncbi:flagella biosynthesis chaperone for FliD, FliT [Shewanella sedimentimangrovi]|uniref:Flagella biosynthesis chaperone for FliD, FliT n=1 Tax=Shewanella sedimentimangrovi TaxID=2814293 RepID=A0ABX7QZQ0_9GAMM|nr:flagella biosynthesis chaperone for FliD, FliT [Shewanella sedimentimangrovi]QSX36081.1 flagella biosynthesis chaperone for FliD, FliT [Shewanella sedimentimangrovi]
MQALDELNSQLDRLLAAVEQIAAADEKSDDLVSELQVKVEERQLLLAELLADESMDDRNYLEHQLMLSNSFTQRALAIQSQRLSLLQAGNKSKRQLDVYKSIDADR